MVESKSDDTPGTAAVRNLMLYFCVTKSYVPGSWFSDLLPHKGKLVHTVATIRVERRKKSAVGRIICLAWKKSAV